MNKTDLTSIIILVQDRYDFLKRCLDSIIEHTKSEFEIVFIDQATTDERIADLIRKYFEDGFLGTVIRNEVNNGVTPGRNQGIEASQGDYLLFFDDDAYVSEDTNHLTEEEKSMDWLQRMTRYFVGNVGIVSQSGSYIDKSTPGMFYTCTEKGVRCDVGQGYCFMFSREVYNAIGGLDAFFGKFWHEESEYALHAKASGFGVINAGYIGVTHYGSGSGDDGSYGSKIKYMFDKWGGAFDRILEPRDSWRI